MAAFDFTSAQPVNAGITGRIASAFVNALGAVKAWNDSRATRVVLSKLSNRELEDIGLSRGDIEGF